MELQLSEYGNARLIYATHGTKIRSIDWQWWMWNGVRWARVGRSAIAALCCEVPGLYRAEAERLRVEIGKAKDAELRRRLTKRAEAVLLHAQKSERWQTMHATVRILEGMCADEGGWESPRWSLNCQNGSLRLDRATLEEHAPEHMHRDCVAADFRPEATAPRWEQFLAEILPDPSVREYVQRAVGYSLTDSVQEQCYFLLVGNGANGKSTFLDTLGDVLGSYAKTINYHSLISPGTTLWPGIEGARFVQVTEVERDSKVVIKEGYLKQMTGSEWLPGVRFRESTQTRVTWKLWLVGNQLPRVRSSDAGMWRRPRVIRFPAEFSGLRQDRSLLEKLRAERDGILVWAIRGAREWLERGLGETQALTTELRDYRMKEQAITTFWTQRMEAAPDARVALADVYSAFVAWATIQGMQVKPDRSQFSRTVTRAGLARARVVRNDHARARYYHGVRMRQEVKHGD